MFFIRNFKKAQYQENNTFLFLNKLKIYKLSVTQFSYLQHITLTVYVNHRCL